MTILILLIQNYNLIDMIDESKCLYQQVKIDSKSQISIH